MFYNSFIFTRGYCYFFEKNICQKRIMHIKRCTRGQNMYIIASLKHALPPPPRVAYVLFKKITIAPWIQTKKYKIEYLTHKLLELTHEQIFVIT